MNGASKAPSKPASGAKGSSKKKAAPIAPVDLFVEMTKGYPPVPILQLAPVPPTEVPRLIHFIWVGPRRGEAKAIPAKYLGNIKKFALLNPTWTVQVWTDNPNRIQPLSVLFGITNIRVITLDEALYLRLLAELALGPELESAWTNGYTTEFDATCNFAAVSDLLRVMILYAQGGVYTDTDNEALAPLQTPFDASLGFRVGTSGDMGVITNALMGAVPHSEFLRAFAMQIACNLQFSHSVASREDYVAAVERFRSNQRRVGEILNLNSLINSISGPLALTLLMEKTTVGGRTVCGDYLKPATTTMIGREYVKVNSDQTWLKGLPGADKVQEAESSGIPVGGEVRGTVQELANQLGIPTRVDYLRMRIQAAAVDLNASPQVRPVFTAGGRVWCVIQAEYSAAGNVFTLERTPDGGFL